MIRENYKYEVLMHTVKANYTSISDFDFEITETESIAKFRKPEDGEKFIKTCKPQFDGENGITYELVYVNEDGEYNPPKNDKEWYQIEIYKKNCKKISIPYYG